MLGVLCLAQAAGPVPSGPGFPLRCRRVPLSAVAIMVQSGVLILVNWHSDCSLAEDAPWAVQEVVCGAKAVGTYKVHVQLRSKCDSSYQEHEICNVLEARHGFVFLCAQA